MRYIEKYSKWTESKSNKLYYFVIEVRSDTGDAIAY
jgi:hypothetical protein